MKKLVSLIAAAAMVSAVSGAAMAADNNPAVYVDGREIFFDDQAAVIKDDRTLVPARGVFEAMGAKVEWDGEKRQVQVTSADEQTIVRLVIDDADMKVYDMSGLFSALLTGQDFHAPETVVTLDVPAQIMNDRTMVPLRAISEAVDAQVDWNGEACCVEIVTNAAEIPAEDAPALSLSTSADKVAEGETVDVFVNIKNVPADLFVKDVTAILSYDADNFEYVSTTLVNGENEIASAVGATNPEFGSKGYIKAGYVVADNDTAVKEDAAVLKITFKSVNGAEGSFALSDGYNTKHGYNTVIDFSDAESNLFACNGNKLAIDTTPVFVNLEAAE